MTAVEDGDRQQVQEAEVEADGRHQGEQRRPANLGGVTRQLRDGNRTHELPGRRLAREQAPQRLEDQHGTLEVTLHAETQGLDGAGLEGAQLVVAELDANQAHIPALLGRHAHLHRAALAAERQVEGNACAPVDDRNERVVVSDLPAVDLEDHVSRPQPRAICGLTRRDRPHEVVHLGKHADVANLEPRLGGRRHLQRHALAVPQHLHRDLEVRFREDGHEEVFPRVDRAARDREDLVAPPDAGRLGGRLGHDASDDGRLGLVGRHLGTLVQDASQDDHGQHDVHRRPHDEDQEAIPLAPRQKLFRSTIPGLVRILAGHLHVTAERDGADAVLGVAALKTEDFRAESEREREHADAEPLGHQVVTQLVHEDQHAEDEQESENAGRHVDIPRVPSRARPGRTKIRLFCPLAWQLSRL